MYHYLFTNDLRISTLDDALKEAGICFVEETVPSASENKSANNNMKTLGFYFNLTNNSNCAKLAAKGNIKAVVLNFIKKFQFPNLRTVESLNECKNDGILLAPMRIIVKVLFMMNLLSESDSAYITREEIKMFIMYNDNIAKSQVHDYIRLINDIKNYRNTGEYPSYISLNEAEHFWKHEERQIREMVKILTWSGCISEISDGKLVISNDELLPENKAAVYDIINYNKYWNGDNLDDYQRYMDIDIEPVIVSAHENHDFKKKSGGSNILFYGVPGAGKSHRIDEIIKDSDYERVVFHPDYTYSDFVGQIMPRLKRDDSGNEKLTYEFVPGPFTKALKAAESNPGSMFYLIIEEINRGNAPAIFGDIFQLLDRNDDGSGKYRITNFDIAGEVYDDENEKIVMPSNLTILATMNTSDQNIFTLDTAFQRRWDMKYIINDVNGAEHAGARIGNSEITWSQFANTINKILADSSYELGNSEDKQLGAYFVKEDELSDEKFPEKVLKYLLNDAFRMEPDLIFNENIKSIGDIIEVYGKEGDPIRRIMKKDVYERMMDISAASPAEATDDTETFESKEAE